MGSVELRNLQNLKIAELQAKQDQVQRLHDAVRETKTPTNEMGFIINDIKASTDTQGIWTGDKYNKFDDYTKNTFVGTDFENYMSMVDQALGEIYAKIIELTNEIDILNLEISSLSWQISVAEAAERAAAEAARAASAQAGRRR